MRTRTLLILALSVCLLYLGAAGLAGCGGNWLSGLGFNGGTGGGGQQVTAPRGGILGSKDELARLLTQLQWLFIGLGIAAFVASFWISLISTRHAVGSLIFGIVIAVAKPIILLLYWPTVIALGIGVAVAVWPYVLAVITWFRVHISGGIDKSELTSGWASIKSLWTPRAVANGSSPNPKPDTQ